MAWSWLVSLLGAGSMVVYISSPILRNHSVGRQDMENTRYDSMVGLIQDVSSGLWDRVFFQLQVSCAFVVDTTTHLVKEISEINLSVIE